jgi:hypothetical protein
MPAESDGKTGKAWINQLKSRDFIDEANTFSELYSIFKLWRKHPLVPLNSSDTFLSE